MFAPVLALKVPTPTPTPSLPTDYGWIGQGMYYSVDSQSEIKVGEDISVNFYFLTECDVHIDSISVSLQGAGVDYSKTIVVDTNLDSGTEITDTATVTSRYKGRIYCEIEAEYSYSYGLQRYYQYGHLYHVIAYARYTTYHELLPGREYWKSEYASLNSSYYELEDDCKELNSTYNALKANYDDLTVDFNTAKNLNYLFIITTIIFIATTAYLVLRKPKAKPT